MKTRPFLQSLKKNTRLAQWKSTKAPQVRVLQRAPLKATYIALFASLVFGAVCVAGDVSTNRATPRFKARVVCFNGKIDSDNLCAATNFQPDGTVHSTGKLTCGPPGKVSEIEWSFLERKGDQDVYRFTRRFPADTGATSTTAKNVKFSKTRVIVFQDKFQVVVIEPPK